MYTRKKGTVSRAADGSPVPKTSHTLAEVPFIVMDPRSTLDVVDGEHGLASIATTVLLPLEPVTATTGRPTWREKMSISPVMGTPAWRAASIAGVFKLTPGLTTSSLACNKVSMENSPNW